MDRRTLLGRLTAGAAAVLGLGMAAPKAEATGVPFSPEAHDAIMAAYERGRAIEAARSESRSALGLPIARGALTVEDLAEDCRVRGCGLFVIPTRHGEWLVSHRTVAQGYAGTDRFFEPDVMLIDAWRRSLHETPA